ncbi:hypothetical protein [Thalassoporum mexicanum]|nr:hypothetical protein [Pseudanabaena sp. PCC 7367]
MTNDNKKHQEKPQAVKQPKPAPKDPPAASGKYVEDVKFGKNKNVLADF